jgi:hypothetical protein
VVEDFDCFQAKEREAAGDARGEDVLRDRDAALDLLQNKTNRGREEVRLGEGKRLRPMRGCGVAWSHRISEF